MKNRPNTTETLVANLRALMRHTGIGKDTLAKKSGVSERMIAYILSGERKPTVEVADALASTFGITGWQLLIPKIPVELANTDKLKRLVEDYANSSDTAQKYINEVAEQSAQYKTKK